MHEAAGGASNDAAKPTNMDRLRTHLAVDGLASKLLHAWLAGPITDAQARMLAVLNSHNSTTQVTDAGSAHPKT
jgi:hypothetical protein